MIDKPIFQSKTPIAFFVGLAISLYLLIVCVVKIDFPDSLIYPIVVFGLWFLTISRFSGKLIIYQDKILLKYSGFWHRDEEISLLDKKQIKIKQSAWNFNSRYDYEIMRGHIFYDTIFLIDQLNNVTSIKVNTRIGQLYKAIDIIENQIKNNC